ncbi:acyltransferase [uncultured Bradyrhizobium sp.]|uniref:acyltransferase n=1 Tax=uncultured Bradyrhizobium sp. TaxID=199684 RepID=UPI0034123424
MPRRIVIDLMRASAGVPFVAVRRTLDIGRLAAARSALASRPAWPTIFAKAFAVVAKENPILRTSYLRWPWSRFYELPQTIAMIVVAPDATPDGVLLFPVKAPDLVPLPDADAWVRSAKTSPIAATRFFRRTYAVTRLPLPLRRLAWLLGLNVGRWRANYFGTVLITSVAAFGGGELEALGPTSFILSYDKVASDGTINVMVRWDHRVTDAAVVGGVLSRLEQILNEIADELLALAPVEHVSSDTAPQEWIGSRLTGSLSR